MVEVVPPVDGKVDLFFCGMGGWGGRVGEVSKEDDLWGRR